MYAEHKFDIQNAHKTLIKCLKHVQYVAPFAAVCLIHQI